MRRLGMSRRFVSPMEPKRIGNSARRSPMEPQVVTLIVCGILLVLTMLAGTPNRRVEPKDVELIDFSEPEELRHSLN